MAKRYIIVERCSAKSCPYYEIHPILHKRYCKLVSKNYGDTIDRRVKTFPRSCPLNKVENFKQHTTSPAQNADAHRASGE